MRAIYYMIIRFACSAAVLHAIKLVGPTVAKKSSCVAKHIRYGACGWVFFLRRLA